MENEMSQGAHNPNRCFTVLSDKITCVSCTAPDCGFDELLEADTSAFHTDEIAQATRSINKILSEIQPAHEGQTLSFIQTRMGIMLVWVESKDEDEAFRASADQDEIGVTSADDNDTLAKALKLKNYNPTS